MLRRACVQNHGKIHLKPPRNSELIVQMRMFHHVTTVKQVWNTQSPTQNSYEAFIGAILLTSAPPLLPSTLCCEPAAGPYQWSRISWPQQCSILLHTFSHEPKGLPSACHPVLNDGAGCPNSDPILNKFYHSTTSSTYLYSIFHSLLFKTHPNN